MTVKQRIIVHGSVATIDEIADELHDLADHVRTCKPEDFNAEEFANDLQLRKKALVDTAEILRQEVAHA